MKIKYIYSHLYALEGLKAHKLKIWEEIKSTIESIDTNIMKTKKSKEKTMKGRMLYSPSDINAAFKKEFGKKKWKENRQTYYVTSDEELTEKIVKLNPDKQKETITSDGQEPIYSFHQTDFTKDKVAIELQLGKYAFIEFDLFVKHLQYYELKEIDIAIEIVPTKALLNSMSSGPGYYERTLTHIIRQGRGRPSFPFILMGIEPESI